MWGWGWYQTAYSSEISLIKGQAKFTKHFYCWKIVSGDPLSKESINDSSENASNRSLIFLKNIRKRKGLSSYPQIGKLFNDTLLPEFSVG